MKIALISTDHFIYSHGLRSISSYLKKNGHDTIIISMPNPFFSDSTKIRTRWTNLGERGKYSKAALESLIEKVKDCNLIGISCIVITYKKAIQVINSIKPLNIPIVWGGILATTYPQECIKHSDIVCIGEGEKALLELANKMEKGEKYYDTRNFWFRKENGEVIKNEVRDLITNLDDLPYYDYDLDTNYVLEKNKKLVKLNQKHIGYWLYYHSIRGCLYSCKYCCNHELDKLYKGKGCKVRKRSIKLVVEELECLKNKFPKLEWVWIDDDDINMRTLEELKKFGTLYKEKVGLKIKAYMSAPTVNEEKLQTLVDAGLSIIEVGIQTGSDRINKEIYGRFITKEKVIEAAKKINKFTDDIIHVSYQIIVNNPYESKEDKLQTINLLRNIPVPYNVDSFGIIFFPGTPLYYKALKDEYTKEFPDSGYFLDFRDSVQHIRMRKNNPYLDSILFWMSRKSTKSRHGAIPKKFFEFLLKEKTINFFNKHTFILAIINKIYSISEEIVGSTLRFYYLMHPSIHKVKVAIIIFKGRIYSLIPIRIKTPIKHFLNLG